VAQDLRIRETNNLQPSFSEKLRSLLVVEKGFGLKVLAAVHLDRKSLLMTIEIEDIGAKLLLSAKLCSFQPAIP
jgi:hypothetical protein